MRLLVCALLASGCVSWKSVRATAALGDDVAARAHTLDRIGDYCRLAAAAAGHDDPACARLDGDVPAWQKAAARLGVYAAALRAGADGDTRDFKADFSAATAGVGAIVWQAPPPDKLDNIGAALDALVQAASAAYRQKAVAGAVGRAAPHVRLVTTYLRAMLRLQRETLDRLDEEAVRIGQYTDGMAPTEAAARLGVLHLSLWLHDQRDALAAYDRALAAFAAAHDKLAAAAAQLPSRDLEAYESIVDAVKGVYGGP